MEYRVHKERTKSVNVNDPMPRTWNYSKKPRLKAFQIDETTTNVEWNIECSASIHMTNLNFVTNLNIFIFLIRMISITVHYFTHSLHRFFYFRCFSHTEIDVKGIKFISSRWMWTLSVMQSNVIGIWRGRLISRRITSYPLGNGESVWMRKRKNNNSPIDYFTVKFFFFFRGK